MPPSFRSGNLAENGTHAIVDAAIGPYKTNERQLTRQLLPSLHAGMLCLADRGFYSLRYGSYARKRSAHRPWPQPTLSPAQVHSRWTTSTV